jgi:hypothetical protein
VREGGHRNARCTCTIVDVPLSETALTGAGAAMVNATTKSAERLLHPLRSDRASTQLGKWVCPMGFGYVTAGVE